MFFNCFIREQHTNDINRSEIYRKISPNTLRNTALGKDDLENS